MERLRSTVPRSTSRSPTAPAARRHCPPSRSTSTSPNSSISTWPRRRQTPASHGPPQHHRQHGESRRAPHQNCTVRPSPPGSPHPACGSPGLRHRDARSRRAPATMHRLGAACAGRRAGARQPGRPHSGRPACALPGSDRRQGGHRRPSGPVCVTADAQSAAEVLARVGVLGDGHIRDLWDTATGS